MKQSNMDAGRRGAQCAVLKIGAYKIGNKKQSGGCLGRAPAELGTWNKMQLHFAQKFNAFTACPILPTPHRTNPGLFASWKSKRKWQRQKEKRGEQRGRRESGHSKLTTQWRKFAFLQRIHNQPSAPLQSRPHPHLPASHSTPYAHTHTHPHTEADSWRYRYRQSCSYSKSICHVS